MADDTRSEQRIAKLLARAGVASRREVERMIADGRVALNGQVLDTPATLLRSLHGVTVDGQPVAAPPPARLFLFHKPVGLLVTERDPKGRPTIYDRLPPDLPRLVPVGRLDLNTEGLLLLTTDGGLKRQLELPATGVERAYRARAYGEISQAQLEELIEGVEIDGVRYGPIDANLERRTGANVWIELVLTEGKNREVRRVLEHLGLQVSRLIRTRYGSFVLGDLQPGEIGEVRQADLVAFRRMLEKKQKPDHAVAVGPLASDAPRIRPGEGDRSPRASGGGARPTAPRPDRESRPVSKRQPSSKDRPAPSGEGKGMGQRRTALDARPGAPARAPRTTGEPARARKGEDRAGPTTPAKASPPNGRSPKRPPRPSGQATPRGPRRPRKP